VRLVLVRWLRLVQQRFFQQLLLVMPEGASGWRLPLNA
jgi:hypothetical protein